MYEYLQIKGATTRKDRNNITEPNEDSSMKASDIRETTFKKQDNRVAELENEVRDLRADLLNKEKTISELASRQHHLQLES
jgi:predicted RNase H-like nuclease (RuvC/YqgF family)